MMDVLKFVFAACLLSIVCNVSASTVKPSNSGIIFEHSPSYMGERCVYTIKVDGVNYAKLKPRQRVIVRVANGRHRVNIGFDAKSQCRFYQKIDFNVYAPAIYSVTIGTHSSIVVGQL